MNQSRPSLRTRLAWHWAMRIADAITLGGCFLVLCRLETQIGAEAFLSSPDEDESGGSNSTFLGSTGFTPPHGSSSDDVSETEEEKDQRKWQEQQKQYHEVSLFVILPVMLSILGTTGLIVFCTFRRVHRPLSPSDLAAASQARRITALELLHAFRPAESIHKEGMPVRMVATRQLLIDAFEKMPFMYVYDRQMDAMLGKEFVVQEVLLNGMVGLPSPDGSQGGIWFFPPQAVVPVRHSLNTFPYHMPTQSEEQEDRFEPMCTICLLDFEAGEQVAKLPCLHIFHAECIQGWLAQHWQCPYRCPGFVNIPKEEDTARATILTIERGVSPREGANNGRRGADPLIVGLRSSEGRAPERMHSWDLPGAIHRELTVE